MACLGIILLQGCATYPVRPPSPHFSPVEITSIVSELRKQEMRVHTFFSTGQLTVKSEGSGSEYNILVVGTREAQKIKIEITHSWGRPILHVLINEKGVHVLSFPEKRLYKGQPGTFVLPEFFTGKLDFAQLWGLVRGYPVLRKNIKSASSSGHQIAFKNEKGEEVQVMHFYDEKKLPRLISFPGEATEMLFSKFEKNIKGIYYARNIVLENSDNKSILALNFKQMVFNKPIPEAIYKLEKPSDFKLVPLKSSRKE